MLCVWGQSREKRRRQKQHKSQNEIYWVNMECDVRLSYTIFEHFSASRASPFTMFTKSLSLFPPHIFLSLNISAASPLSEKQQLWSRWSENRLSAYATEWDDEFINRWHCLATVDRGRAEVCGFNDSSLLPFYLDTVRRNWMNSVWLTHRNKWDRRREWRLNWRKIGFSKQGVESWMMCYWKLKL